MRVGFIGAGKVGQSFGIFLASKNISISGYYSKSAHSAQMAASQLNCTAFATLEHLVEASDIIAITVNDDQISAVAQAIQRLNSNTKDKLFFHMSGAHDSSALKALSAHVFSLHPLRAFPDIVESHHAFDGIYFSLEGADEVVLKWVKLLDIQYFELDKSQKAKYHSAAVIVSNYLVSVIDFGLKQLEEIGLSSDNAQKALWPLVTNTIENIEKLGTKRALTGPIVRGDVETIQKHLEALGKESQTLYRALGQYTLSITEHDEMTKRHLMTLFKEDKDGKNNNNDVC